MRGSLTQPAVTAMSFAMVSSLYAMHLISRALQESVMTAAYRRRA